MSNTPHTIDESSNARPRLGSPNRGRKSRAPQNRRLQNRRLQGRGIHRLGRLHLLAVAALLIALVAAIAPAAAQESIEEAKERREQARQSELQARAAFDILEAEWEEIEIAFQAADELVQRSEAKAEATRALLAMAEQRVRATEIGLAWATYDRETLSDELADLAVREYLGTHTEENLLESTDLNETVTRNAVLRAVSGATYDVVDTARAAADRQEELREQAELEIAEVKRLEQALNEEQAELQQALDVRARARDALDARLDEWSDVIDEWEAIEQDLTDFIVVEQQRAELQAQLDAIRSTQGYVWPTAGGIGSYFGWRKHPILGYSRLHGGLDIGGRWGQPIVAAKEGVVIMARANGGYGNTIIIDHGNGYASLYGHQSTFEVKEGDVVATGEHIGNVGSTGLSTGPHLHFEIRVNGEVTDPLPLLPAR